MRALNYCTKRDLQFASIFALLLGLSLAFGLLPSLHRLASILNPHISFELPLITLDTLLFPASAAFLYFSLPSRARQSRLIYRGLLQTLILPTLIAFMFGLVRKLFFGLASFSFAQDLIWYVACIPLGEELIFRAWLYVIAERLFQGKYLSWTNPLPVQIWISALAFALWHLQNAAGVSLGFLALQVMYTFFTGLWLGWLRWKSEGWYLPCFAHSLLNFAALLPLLA